VIDVSQRQRSDLFLLRDGEPPVLLLNEPPGRAAEPSRAFRPVPVGCPPLRQAHMIDLDLDGWPDVVGLSDDRRPVLLHNVAGRLSHAAGGLGHDKDWPRDLIALAVLDVDGDGYPDLLGWSEGKGLVAMVSRGNGNYGLRLRPTTERYHRCNRDGLGTWISARAGPHRASMEYPTLSAALGQSRQPVLLGMRRHRRAELVRLRWHGTRRQALMDLPAGPTHTVRHPPPVW